MRWRADVRRTVALGIFPPDLMMSYRAMESIFGTVFDKAEPQLNLRWNMLKNKLGLPHHITEHSLAEVSNFADAELSALVLLGNSGLNTGLPLTENQKARNAQIKDSEKKRAAAAKATAANTTAAAPTAKPTPPTTPGEAVAARLSSPTSTWAPTCTFWTKGECRNGISCKFMHCGIPTEQNRCFICASAEHRSNACTRPGGGADPKKDEHWAEYRKRRAENGKGDGAAGKGKGKGGGKGTGKGKEGGKGYKGGKGGGAAPATAAMAAEDVPAARACMDIAAAASVNESAKFPREGVALDSWANVWLKHQRSMPESYYADVLHLAFGDCPCHRETGKKGVPTVHVP